VYHIPFGSFWALRSAPRAAPSGAFLVVVRWRVLLPRACALLDLGAVTPTPPYPQAGGGGEYSTLERLTPTKHGRLRRVILEVYATTAHSVVFPRSQQLGLTTRFGMSLWRGELPVDSGRVLPTGWAEAGVLIGRKELA